MRNRPIGLGIQGLADTLARMKINFESNEAVEFNSHMMETIYHASISASCDISKERLSHPAFLIKVLLCSVTTSICFCFSAIKLPIPCGM